jgi:hypothetical protein
VNAHHALKRLSDRPDPPTFAEVSTISPLPKSRLKVVLSLLVGKEVVEEDGGRIRLLQEDLTPAERHRMAGDYRDRDERDRLKQSRMAASA